MTQEEKSLLLQDLCGRVYHGVLFMVHDDEINEPVKLLSINPKRDKPLELDDGCGENSSTYWNLEDVKPYLRSMSSMTEEEQKELEKIIDGILGYKARNYFHSEDDYKWNTLYEAIDWLNAHHFDYRGLIPKNLAIEITKENNPYEV